MDWIDVVETVVVLGGVALALLGQPKPGEERSFGMNLMALMVALGAATVLIVLVVGAG